MFDNPSKYHLSTSLFGHAENAHINALAFSPDNTLLASGGKHLVVPQDKSQLALGDDGIKVWTVADSAELPTPVHRSDLGPITALVWLKGSAVGRNPLAFGTGVGSLIALDYSFKHVRSLRRLLHQLTNGLYRSASVRQDSFECQVVRL